MLHISAYFDIFSKPTFCCLKYLIQRHVWTLVTTLGQFRKKNIWQIVVKQVFFKPKIDNIAMLTSSVGQTFNSSLGFFFIYYQDVSFWKYRIKLLTLNFVFIYYQGVSFWKCRIMLLTLNTNILSTIFLRSWWNDVGTNLRVQFICWPLMTWVDLINYYTYFAPWPIPTWLSNYMLLDDKYYWLSP